MQVWGRGKPLPGGRREGGISFAIILNHAATRGWWDSINIMLMVPLRLTGDRGVKEPIMHRCMYTDFGRQTHRQITGGQTK